MLSGSLRRGSGVCPSGWGYCNLADGDGESRPGTGSVRRALVLLLVPSLKSCNPCASAAEARDGVGGVMLFCDRLPRLILSCDTNNRVLGLDYCRVRLLLRAVAECDGREQLERRAVPTGSGGGRTPDLVQFRRCAACWTSTRAHSDMMISQSKDLQSCALEYGYLIDYCRHATKHRPPCPLPAFSGEQGDSRRIPTVHQDAVLRLPHHPLQLLRLSLAPNTTSAA